MQLVSVDGIYRLPSHAPALPKDRIISVGKDSFAGTWLAFIEI